MRKVLSLLFVIFISILIVGCDKKSNIDDFVFSGSNLVEYKGTSENVEIPESYEKDGTIIEVQSIKLGVFSYNSVIKSIVVPKGVTSLHENMFAGCYSLEKVEFKGSIKYIPNYCFDRCYNLTFVNFSSGLKSIGSHAFNECVSLEEFIAPMGVETLGEAAFKSCVSLKKVELKSGVNSIAKRCFENCHALKTIIFPKTEYTIGEAAFKNCTSLTEINLSNCTNINVYILRSLPNLSKLIVEDNEIYKTYDSVLYNEETKTLVFYPPKKKDKEYTVLDGTKAIGASAFLNAVNLKSVNINAPIDVENKDHFKIQDNAFEGCEKLNEVISNNSVFYVGYKAFKDCPNLKKVVVNDELFVPSNSKVFENSPNAMFYSQNSQWRPEN